jgi:hypothetical protein
MTRFAVATGCTSPDGAQSWGVEVASAWMERCGVLFRAYPYLFPLNMTFHAVYELVTCMMFFVILLMDFVSLSAARQLGIDFLATGSFYDVWDVAGLASVTCAICRFE